MVDSSQHYFAILLEITKTSTRCTAEHEKVIDVRLLHYVLNSFATLSDETDTVKLTNTQMAETFQILTSRVGTLCVQEITEREREREREEREKRERERERERTRDTETQSERETERQRESSNSNSKILFYKDCSLGSVKNLSNN